MSNGRGDKQSWDSKTTATAVSACFKMKNIQSDVTEEVAEPSDDVDRGLISQV